jgi:HlyD family secretion protein
MKRAIIAFLIIAAIGAGAGAYYMKRGGEEIAVNTAPVTRGDIVDTVGASGTLQAVTTVQIGSQVSGIISWLGADFNSIVRKGQIIAKLDPSLFQAQVEQARANFVKSQADLERNKVALADAQTKYMRAKELSARSLIPQSELDAAQVAVDAAQAMLQSSAASVSQAQASLNQSLVNLEHTVIDTPIDGIVTQRNVDVGQTVAASLQSPTLFIIAADLTKMQVNANIDEADVGRIRPGQHVTFRVDAYPTDEFEGTVAQIRLQPVVLQNVTTYGTVIDVPNPQLKLKPGMTANVKVEVAKRNDVLRVPNAALRFRPTAEVFAALNQAVPPDATGGRGGRARTGGDRPAPSASADQNPPAGATAAGAAARTAEGSGAGGRAGASGRGNVERRSGGGGGADVSGRRGGGMERFAAMSPDEQQRFIARLKERGADVSAFESAAKGRSAAAASSMFKPKYGEAQSAQTIDALFAPIPAVDTRGRVWVFMNHELKPVNVRLGISDGTNTELLSGELQANTEIVTGVTGVGSVRPTATAGAGTGNPFNQQRGRGR